MTYYVILNAILVLLAVSSCCDDSIEEISQIEISQKDQVVATRISRIICMESGEVQFGFLYLSFSSDRNILMVEGANLHLLDPLLFETGCKRFPRCTRPNVVISTLPSELPGNVVSEVDLELWKRVLKSLFEQVEVAEVKLNGTGANSPSLKSTIPNGVVVVPQ